jgi:leucyl-tRNA synthetase
LVIQINGKKRAILLVKPDMEEENLFSMSLDLENVKKFVENKKILKKIYIKNKLINYVIAE